MTARAESSERLNSEIVSSLTSGLLVVGLRGEVRMLNPAGRRLLRLGSDDSAGHFRGCCGKRRRWPTSWRSVSRTRSPWSAGPVTIRRRDHAHTHVGVTVSPLFDERAACREPSACSPT